MVDETGQKMMSAVRESGSWRALMVLFPLASISIRVKVVTASSIRA